MTEAMITLAETPADIDAVKHLFKAFADWLPIDLAFQGFEAEMATFPRQYVFLLLAKIGGKPVGAVALKEHTPDICEMKRLYVLPDAQGVGLGRDLSLRLIEEAKSRGYSKMLLDSLRRLEAAVGLYRALGFTEIEPYNYNPEDDVVYMERAL